MAMFPLVAAVTALVQPAAPAPAATAEARVAMHAFGRCVADASPEFAAETLNMDFRSQGYRTRLRQLATNNASCLREGVMRAGGLALAGGVAERLLARDPQPLNVRLARAAAGPAPQTYSPTDAVAVCVVRSVPDDVARLLASETASEDEGKAAQALSPALTACNRGGPRRIEASVGGMRSMVATAAYRALSRPARPNETRN